jgi:hypothetical protein
LGSFQGQIYPWPVDSEQRTIDANPDCWGMIDEDGAHGKAAGASTRKPQQEIGLIPTSTFNTAIPRSPGLSDALLPPRRARRR